MATRRSTKAPEYPAALAALIERWQKKTPLAVEMLDTLAAEPSLQEFLVPEGTVTNQDAWNAEFKAFYAWAATDLAKPMPSIAHLVQAKAKSTKADFANTPKGAKRSGGKRRDRASGGAEIDAFCDDLLAIPEHRTAGWTFGIHLMRYLGGSADYKEFRERFKAAQARAGVESKRARKPKVEPESAIEPDPEPPKRTRRTTKKSAA